MSGSVPTPTHTQKTFTYTQKAQKMHGHPTQHLVHKMCPHANGSSFAGSPETTLNMLHLYNAQSLSFTVVTICGHYTSTLQARALY
mmetsp:Transcript_23430/g.40372  ORF Transcript_23430/g.40372 Transcript_23430/m.40372 type:complete len:86 (-) Transcript_23430:449-706(-)